MFFSVQIQRHGTYIQLDDFCALFASAKPFAFRTKFQYLCGIHSSVALFAIHIRLSCGLHHNEMVNRLVYSNSSTSQLVEYADIHVSIPWHYKTWRAAFQRTSVRSSCAALNRRYMCSVDALR